MKITPWVICFWELPWLSVSEEDLYDAPDSQESILEEIYNLDQEIVAQEHSLKVARKSLTQKEKAM